MHKETLHMQKNILHQHLEIMHVLKNIIRDSLDPMMLPFKQLNPSFYSQYLSVRTIIYHPGTHTSKEEDDKDTPTETPK